MRGVLYLKWKGNREAVEAAFERSLESLKRWHPELPHTVIELPDGSNYLDKVAMMDMSPYETTLYLDCDTVLMGRVDYGFAAAEQFGLACCINENPWANRHGGIKVETVEYNAGVMFFTKQVKPLFDKWKELAAWVDSSVLFYRDGELCRMNVNDQASLAAACRVMAFNPHVLPLNFNYRPAWQPQFCGPIKIWHDWSNVADGLEAWNESQTKPDSVIQSAYFQKS